MKYNKMDIRELWSVGVLITVPPYPNNSPDVYLSVGKGLPLLKVPEDGFYPHDLEYKDKEWITGGVLGYVCSVCGAGESLEEVRKEVYKKAKELILPKKQYRIDIGEKNPFEGVKI
jgi:phosphoribosylamine--glycine ligase